MELSIQPVRWASVLQTHSVLILQTHSVLIRLKAVAEPRNLENPVPDAVAEELAAHPNPVAHAAILTAIREGWLKTASPQSPALLGILLASLDRVRRKPSCLPSISRPTS